MGEYIKKEPQKPHKIRLRDSESLLDGNGWYDSKHMELLYTYYKKLVDTRSMLNKAVTGTEKMNLNKDIKKVIQRMNDINMI